MVSKYEITDPDFVRSFQALEARVSKLERTPQLLNSSVDSRGIDVYGGGEIRIHDGSIKIMDASDNVRVQLGHLPDGSYDVAANNYILDDLGNITSTVTVDLATLAFGQQAAFNTNNGSTTAIPYGDLSGVTGPGDLNYGPAVTVNIGNSARALVVIGCQMQCTPTGSNDSKGAMSFAVSGATTIAPSDGQGLVFFEQISDPTPINFLNWVFRASYMHMVTGLNPGSNTFTAKYRADSGSGTTANFTDRTIVVMPF